MPKPLHFEAHYAIVSVNTPDTTEFQLGLTWSAPVREGNFATPPQSKRPLSLKRNTVSWDGSLECHVSSGADYRRSGT